MKEAGEIWFAARCLKIFQRIWHVVVVLAWGTLLAFLIQFGLYLYCGSYDYILTAQNNIPVFLSEEQAWNSLNCGYAAMLSSGQRVRATQCISGKDRLAYNVRLPNGESGFVSKGDYEVKWIGRNDFCRCIGQLAKKVTSPYEADK